jgi:lysophospholipase L1-like esterase
MYAMGLVPAPDELKMDESLRADPAVAAVAVLAVRYELGNSFFAHPNEKGHDEITEAVMYALENNVSGDEFTMNKLSGLIKLVQDLIRAKDEAVDAIAGITAEDLLVGFDIAKKLLGEAYDDVKAGFGYTYDADSYYVALGDANAYGPAAKLLAEKLGVDYADLTAADVTAADVLAQLAANAAEIEKADLITLGFSANAFMSFAGKQAKAAMTGKDVAEMDWAALVGAEAAAKIAAELAKLSDSIAQSGIPAQYADVAAVAVESYAYAYVAHLLGYVELAESIRAINGEAVLALAGMNNPMDGLVIDLNGEALDLGKYVGYIVDLANLGTLGYAVYAADTVYADVMDVETGFEGKTMGAVNFVLELLSFDKAAAKYAPTEAGYAYIAGQLYDALNPVAAGDKEEDKDDEEVVPPHVHGAPKDGVKFVWTADNKACVAEYVCSGCGEKLTAKCDVKMETKQPTVEAEGYVKYTATVEIAGKSYSDEQTEVLAKLPAPVVPEKPEVPETSDGMTVGLYMAVLVAAAGAVVVLKKKKHA